MEYPVIIISEKSPSKKDPIYIYVRETVKEATSTKSSKINEYWFDRVIQDTFDQNKFNLISYYIFRKLKKKKKLSTAKIIKFLYLCLRIQLEGDKKFFEEVNNHEEHILVYLNYNQSKTKGLSNIVRKIRLANIKLI